MTPAPINPDLVELIAYNRAGCHHPDVPHVVPKAEVEAIRAAGGILMMNGFAAVMCHGCKEMVPTRPPKGSAGQ